MLAARGAKSFLFFFGGGGGGEDTSLPPSSCAATHKKISTCGYNKQLCVISLLTILVEETTITLRLSWQIMN